MSATIFTIPQRKHYIDIFTTAVSYAIDNNISRPEIDVETVMNAYFDEVNSKPVISRSRSSVSPEEKAEREAKKAAKAAEREAKKAAKAAEREAKKAAKAAEREAKKAAKASEKKEWMTPVRLTDSNGKDIRGTNGAYLRIQKHRHTGEIRKTNEKNWTDEAHKIFDELHGGIIPNATANLVNVLSESKTDDTATPTQTVPPKNDKRAKALALKKQMLAAKAEKKAKEEAEAKALAKAMAEAQAKAEAEAQAKAEAEAQAKALADMESNTQNGTTDTASYEHKMQEPENPEIHHDGTDDTDDEELMVEDFDAPDQKEYFTNEKFPGIQLYKDDDDMIYNAETGECVGLMMEGEITTV